MKALLSIFPLITLSFSSSAAEHNLNLRTIRGDEVKAVVHFPNDSREKYPAVIIAPGQGYHMELPLIKQLAQAAAANSIIALRFDWNYFTTGSTPSPDLSKEMQDIEAALEAVAQMPNVDQNQIMIAGKSLGTLVSYQLFQSRPTLHSLYLLTPLCTWYWDEEENEVAPYSVGDLRYPNFANEKRPIFMTLGNQDPSCLTPMLYDFLGQAGHSSATLAIFGGDHSLNVGPWDDSSYNARNEANINAAIQASVQWMKINLGI